MPSDPVILSLDTTAAHCAAALLCGNQIIDQAFEPMVKGQAERLLVLVTELLNAQNLVPSDLSGVAVCTGPGNFTGIRIGVSATRGLALSLGVPAIGISRLEALTYGTSEPVFALLDARQDNVFIQAFANGLTSDEPILIARDQVTHHTGDTQIVVLSDDTGVLAWTNALTVSPAQIVVNVAGLAVQQLDRNPPLPAPLYIRAPNAALPTDPPPTILP